MARIECARDEGLPNVVQELVALELASRYPLSKGPSRGLRADRTALVEVAVDVVQWFVLARPLPGAAD